MSLPYLGMLGEEWAQHYDIKNWLNLQLFTLEDNNIQIKIKYKSTL